MLPPVLDRYRRSDTFARMDELVVTVTIPIRVRLVLDPVVVPVSELDGLPAVNGHSNGHSAPRELSEWVQTSVDAVDVDDGVNGVEWVCEVCGKTFGSSQARGSHRFQSHGLHATPVATDDDDVWVCEKCGSVRATRQALGTHRFHAHGIRSVTRRR